MTYGFDIGAVMKAILEKILQAEIPLAFCIDSKSLYNCLVKLESFTKSVSLLML